jgi:ERCC4-related helicase
VILFTKPRNGVPAHVPSGRMVQMASIDHNDGSDASLEVPRAQTPRPYQQRIIDALRSSARGGVVMMPTGSCKTLVACVVLQAEIRTARAENRRNAKGLFLVPSVHLVHQQAKVLEQEQFKDLTVTKLSGSDRPQLVNDVLVATPDAFMNFIQQSVINPTDFCVIVFDEVHHCLRDHPYRKLAHRLHVSYGRRPDSISSAALLGGGWQAAFR